MIWFLHFAFPSSAQQVVKLTNPPRNALTAGKRDRTVGVSAIPLLCGSRDQSAQYALAKAN